MTRRTFGPKGEENTGNWRKLHEGELYNFCLLLNIMRVGFTSKRVR